MAYARNSDGTTILMLTKDNLTMWVLDIRARLRKKELWKHTQSAFKPSFVLNNESTSEQRAQIEAEESEWNKKTMQAADEMTPRISLEVKQMLEASHYDNGYLMLGRLYQLLQPVGDAQFMRLTKEFYSLKMDTFKDMSEFLTHIKILMEKINATQMPFTQDKQLIICMMMAMSARYEALSQMWSMMPKLTSEQARNMLLEEERRQNCKTELDYRVTSDQNKNNKKKCPHCGRGIHPEDKCWKLHPELAPDWFKEKEKEDNKDKSKSKGGASKASYADYSVAF